MEQQAFVSQQAGDDAPLRDQVLAMLRAQSSGALWNLAGAAREQLQDTMAGNPIRPANPLVEAQVEPTATQNLLHELAASPRLNTHRFHCEGEVARGGMGSIQRIHDRHLNRHLAMKVLRDESCSLGIDSASLQQRRLARFLEEAQVTSQLDHPGVVPVHDLGLDHNSEVYFTMRLVKGQTAGEVFALARQAQDGWTTSRALDVILKVCDTIAFAHDKGVLHRDLKPNNVMVGRFGEVYVLDWGLAKVLGRAEDPAEQSGQLEQMPPAMGATRTGDALGTPSYMPPEQASGLALDSRADVYAIGAMLYELLAGTAPYAHDGAGADATWRQRLDRVKAGPPPRVETLAPHAPAELSAIVSKAMHRDREQRYGSAFDLAVDLRAFLDQRSVQAYQTGALVELKLWVRRNKPLAASLAAAVLFLVLGMVGTIVYADRADKNATLAISRADLNAQLAGANAALAIEQTKARENFERKVHEFNQLAGVELYDRTIAHQRELYPPWPQTAPAMEKWLRDDLGKLLSLQPEIENTVLDLRRTALPPSADQLEAERRAHPRFADFQLWSNKVTSLRYAQTVRFGKQSLETPELARGQQGLDVRALVKIAWDRVAPLAMDGQPEARTVYAQEALGLAAARLAAAKAKGTILESAIQDTLAWALLANGQDQAAEAASKKALELAPEDQIARYEERLRGIQSAAARAAEILAAAEQKLGELVKALDERRSFQLASDSDQFLHDTLVGLLGKIPKLIAEEKSQVETSLQWAGQVQALSLAHPNRRHEWRDVRAEIEANPKYAIHKLALNDENIIGLVPIGENPVTHLWEFYDLRSAWDGQQDASSIVIPEHDAKGAIKVTGKTGIVFVLLPGGSYLMGAQQQDPDLPNYDVDAQPAEWPTEVHLRPFLLARHELTQGQWSRLRDSSQLPANPSQFPAGSPFMNRETASEANPVELITWNQANTLLLRHGMSLPTEAQWEFACRAGGYSPWSCLKQALARHANLSDTSGKDRLTRPLEEWNDGHILHSAVGSFLANAYGFHDMHGNVAEWCADVFDAANGPRRDGDGLQMEATGRLRSHKGGSFNNVAAIARSAYRTGDPPEVTNMALGVRPARNIE